MITRHKPSRWWQTLLGLTLLTTLTLAGLTTAKPVGDSAVNESMTEPEEIVVPVAEKEKVFRMTGRVLMPDGTPAKNAKIAGIGIVNTNTCYGYNITTDREGQYRFEDFLKFVPTDAYRFQAYVSHYPESVTEDELREPFASYHLREIIESPVSEIISFYRDDQESIEHDFVLQEGFPIQGTVRYSDGSPAKDAIVSFLPRKVPEEFKEEMSARFSRGVRTDDEGKYRIYLSPDKYDVSVAKGQYEVLAEVGAGKNPMVDFVLKNITLVRFVHADGTSLFRERNRDALNSVRLELRNLDATGKPRSFSIGYGATLNLQGDIELCPDGQSYILFMSDDFQEGFVGEIPTGLEHFAVVNAPLVPTVKARFRVMDASGKPLIDQDIFCQVTVTHALSEGSSGGLRVGDMIRTDDEGYVTIPVPALGDFADRFRYQLVVSLPKNPDLKARNRPEFRPPLPGSDIDAGEVIFDGDLVGE